MREWGSLGVKACWAPANEDKGGGGAAQQAPSPAFRIASNPGAPEVFSNWLIGVRVNGPNLSVSLGSVRADWTGGAPFVQELGTLTMPHGTAQALAESLFSFMDERGILNRPPPEKAQ